MVDDITIFAGMTSLLIDFRVELIEIDRFGAILAILDPFFVSETRTRF